MPCESRFALAACTEKKERTVFMPTMLFPVQLNAAIPYMRSGTQVLGRVAMSIRVYLLVPSTRSCNVFLISSRLANRLVTFCFVRCARGR